MVNYANGVETRSIIIDTCKKLFLEKGYKNTTYSAIYKAAMVNPGTIAHHFGNKRNIASMLYDETIQVLVKSVDEFFPEEDDTQKAFLGFGLHRKLLYENEDYRRFVMEFMIDDLANDDEERFLRSDFGAYKSAADKVGENKATFLFVAYKGIEAAVDAYYSRHDEDQSFEEILSYYFDIYFCYLPEDEVKKRTARTLELLSTVEVDMEEDFNPKVRKIEKE